MDVRSRIDEIAEKMSAQLRVKGDGLAEVAERAGRKLPRRLRADASTLIEAEKMATHPKLARLVDDRRVARAARRLDRFLEQQDPGKERRGEILDMIARIAFIFVTVVLGAFFFLLWRGYFE